MLPIAGLHVAAQNSPSSCYSHQTHKLGRECSHRAVQCLCQMDIAPICMDITGCARPPSLTAPVLCHGPVGWSLPSGSGGGSPMHALLLHHPPLAVISIVPLSQSSPSSPSRSHLHRPPLAAISIIFPSQTFQ